MKYIVTILLIATLIATSIASTFYGIQYFRYGSVYDDQVVVYDYLQTRTDSAYVRNPMTGSYYLEVENTFQDSINAIFSPYVRFKSGQIHHSGFDPIRELHGVKDEFSLSQLALLYQARTLKRFKLSSVTKSLEVPESISANYGQQGEVDGVYASDVRNRCLHSLRGTVPDTITSVILLIFAFVAIKHPLYVDDYIFIRFSFVNNSNIIGRRLLSIFLNALLFYACIGTIIMCFVGNEELFYSSDNGGSYDGLYMPVVISFIIPVLFAFWAIPSITCWVLDKK